MNTRAVSAITKHMSVHCPPDEEGVMICGYFIQSGGNGMNGSFRIGSWVVEPQINTLTNCDKAAHVEPKIMEVLVCLADSAPEVVPKEKLIRQVWADTFVTDDVLTRCISELRKIFEDDAKAPRYIQTIPRRGYRLMAPVSSNGVAHDVDLNQFIAPVAGNGVAQGVDLKKDERTASLPQPQPQTKLYVWAGALLVLVISLSIWLYLARRFSDPRLPPMQVLPFTSFPDGAGSPAFSPDGNQIAFIWGGEKGDNIDIYTQLVDGGKTLRLTSDPATDISPTWSSDGRRIAFVRITRNEAEIRTVSALGGEERKLITLEENPGWGNVTHLSWSPDGKFIAYSDHKSSEEPASIYLLSVESLEKQKLTSPPELTWGDIKAVFSPDGKSLAVQRFSNRVADDLYIVPVAGGEARRLTFDSASIT